ncbi:MAG: hypothetical protein ACYDBQ_12015 [Thermoplasmatota archaeon]
MQRIGVLLVVGALLAGCLAGRGTAPPTPSYGFALAFNTTACKDNVVGTLVSFAQAQGSLPHGFVARDAQGILGSPEPTGQALIFIDSNVCNANQAEPDGWTEAYQAVYVDPPKVRGNTTHSDLDFYLLSYATTSRVMAARLETVNSTRLLLAREIGSNVTVLPLGGATGSGLLAERSGQGFSYQTTSPAAKPFQSVAHLWHETPAGLLFYEQDDAGAFAQGSGSCTLTDPVMAQAAGFTECPAGSLSLTFTSEAWKGNILYRVGVQAL